MRRIYRAMGCLIIGTIAGALVWGAIVKTILYFLNLQHGEGFAHIPSPFLGWFSLIIGGLNGALIGSVLGYFRAIRPVRAALLSTATTLFVIVSYYLIIDPGISLLIAQPSLVAIRNLIIVAAILAAPSSVIGVLTTLVYTKIFARFETAQRVSLPEDSRSDTEELIKTEDRAEKNSAD